MDSLHRSHARNLSVGRLSRQRGPSSNGLKSQFNTAIIVVDTTKIAGQEIGPISDYIAMLALSQGSITMSARTYRPSPT